MHSALSATCMEQRYINSGPATAPLRSSLHGGSSHSAHSSRRYMHGCPVTAPTALNATGMEAQPQRSTLHVWMPSHSAQRYTYGGPTTAPTALIATCMRCPATALIPTCMEVQRCYVHVKTAFIVPWSAQSMSLNGPISTLRMHTSLSPNPSPRDREPESEPEPDATDVARTRDPAPDPDATDVVRA